MAFPAGKRWVCRRLTNGASGKGQMKKRGVIRALFFYKAASTASPISEQETSFVPSS